MKKLIKKYEVLLNDTEYMIKLFKFKFFHLCMLIDKKISHLIEQ
jgi:hypothetical protein